MIRGLKLIILLIVLAQTSCSWAEYFSIANLSGEQVLLRYSVIQNDSLFPIFNTGPDIYYADDNGMPYWDRPLAPHDENPSENIVELFLEPGTMIIFGHLSNDNYTAHDQYFINGRHFNLEMLEIISPGGTISITPQNFDSHFKKQNGHIRMAIR